MKKDGRHYDRKTKAALRILAVQRIRDGEPVKAVMESLGLCRTTFYKWCPRISDDQPIAESLAMRTGGGRPGKLSPEQKQQVFQWVNGKNLFQYGFDFGLWTRQIIRELILQKFSITLSISSVGKLLAEIGLTAQSHWNAPTSAILKR